MVEMDKGLERRNNLVVERVPSAELLGKMLDMQSSVKVVFYPDGAASRLQR
jgi:hypothetical protein